MTSRKLDQLKRDYLDVQAPPELAGRIRLKTSARTPSRPHRWWLATGVAAAAVVAAFVLRPGPANVESSNPEVLSFAQLADITYVSSYRENLSISHLPVTFESFLKMQSELYQMSF